MGDVMSLRNIFVLSLCIGSIVWAESTREKGTRIAKQVEVAGMGFVGEQSNVELILINANGDRVTRTLESRILERKNEGDMLLNIIQSPKDVEGMKLLTWAFKNKEDEQWLYMPSNKRVKKISSTNKTGSYMGSEFSYEDLGSNEPEKYEHDFVREEDLNSRKAWVLERKPTDKYSGYSRQVIWIDQEWNEPLKIEYYDRKNTLLKEAIFSGHKAFKKIFRPMQIHIKNVQTKKESIFEWKTRSLYKKWNASGFQSNALADD